MKEAAVRTQAPGVNHHILPSRSQPSLSGTYFCHLETAHMGTRSFRHPCGEASGQLIRGPPTVALVGTSSQEPPWVMSPVGSPLSSCGTPAVGQRTDTWLHGHKSPPWCECGTSLKQVRTSMTTCELSI